MENYKTSKRNSLALPCGMTLTDSVRRTQPRRQDALCDDGGFEEVDLDDSAQQHQSSSLLETPVNEAQPPMPPPVARLLDLDDSEGNSGGHFSMGRDKRRRSTVEGDDGDETNAGRFENG